MQTEICSICGKEKEIGQHCINCLLAMEYKNILNYIEEICLHGNELDPTIGEIYEVVHCFSDSCKYHHFDLKNDLYKKITKYKEINQM